MPKKYKFLSSDNAKTFSLIPGFYFIVYLTKLYLIYHKSYNLVGFLFLGVVA